MTRRILLFLSLWTVAQSAAGEAVVIRDGGHVVHIHTPDFRFHFAGTNGTVLAPAHPGAGMLINGEPVVGVKETRAANEFSVSTESGIVAHTSITLVDGVAIFTVTPVTDALHTVRLCLGGMPVAHGLGDAGGWSGTLNLAAEPSRTFRIENNGGSHRWASSFIIFPHNNLAGVVLGSDEQSVTVGRREYCMEVSKVGPITFRYLLGDMPTLYDRYLALRIQAGYPNIKPKFRLFELGWETWASLGWRANAATVQEELSGLLAQGFPVRWAVTGSGFWIDGGTTTSFGQFGEKFQDPESFKRWLHDRDIQWLIGLRTSFVPAGGPYRPERTTRNRNLKGDVYDGNPLSEELARNGYWLTDDRGEPIRVTSRWFPQVPCYLLDGRNPAAARWYADLYTRWGVDGIKEDTMMPCNFGIFDGPIGTLAREGALVMARCGSFSAPGTLLRINDTRGAGEMGTRIPVNYLQYAACGAPNTYSDTIGFKDNEERVENLRHGWLMACTAGLAMGPFHWKNPEMVKAFKRMIRFHYEIAPSKYDAAVKAYQSGYPYTMTPLDIAYPEDQAAAETPSVEWMIGESLLAAPLVEDVRSNKRDVYLPAGTWFDYDTGTAYQGPTTLKDFSVPMDKTPCFVGGKGVIVTRISDDAPLMAKLYPVAKAHTVFHFNHPDGEARSRIAIRRGNGPPVVRDLTEDRQLPVAVCPRSGAVSFQILPHHDYRCDLGTDPGDGGTDGGAAAR